MTPDGRHCLVSNARSGVVRVFEVASRREVRVLSFEAEADAGEGRLFGDQFGDSSVPIGLVVSADGTRAYVAHANTDVISVIDLTSWKVAGRLRAGREPDGMAFVPAQ
jgi:DNA-binding beta-propeller fold protein YncE